MGTIHERKIPGALPLSVDGLSTKAQDLYYRSKNFIEKHVIPAEKELELFSSNPANKWKIPPQIEELKAKAKAEGLWNLFMPRDCDPEGQYGAGLTNVEYSYICEMTGVFPTASEAFNCSYPDSGNMELLVRYGTEEQRRQWLQPLLEGSMRSCFAMTEPAVASSDARNIQASIRREGNQYVINGHKWWTTGALDPRCKFCILMGKTDPHAHVSSQHSLVIVPMDTPGVRVLRPLHVFGFDHAPHGHAEILFENVRVPASNMILGEGRGFEIAQSRLGSARIHHCMRHIGIAEKALSLMVERVQNREAFGKPLAEQGTIQQDIAKSRIEIEQCHLLTLKAAHMMDTVGSKAAVPEIAMIKIAALTMCFRVLDRAIQAHGGLGVCQDTPLADLYTNTRALRIADGPEEVHERTLARVEFQRQKQAKL